MLVVVALIGVSNALYVLHMHREGGKNDVPPLAMPAHYVIQRPHAGRFDDACVIRGWSKLSPAAPDFVLGADRERGLGVLRVADTVPPAQLRVSLRDPAPFPTVLQIEFVGALPDDGDHVLVREAKRVLTTLDDACGVPYVPPAECGALRTPACRAFGRP